MMTNENENVPKVCVSKDNIDRLALPYYQYNVEYVFKVENGHTVELNDEPFKQHISFEGLLSKQ